MKTNKKIMVPLILLVGLTFACAISAQDPTDVNLTTEINDLNDNVVEMNENIEMVSDNSSCCEDESEHQTYYVSPDPDNSNQVQKPTVQPVIDKAKPGDTIVLNGTFVHCHFLINKTLTILATPETSVGVCPHHTHMMKYGVGPESNGIFYISPEANGTVISGFSFTNDFYYMANKVYNPFGIFVDANDVTLENLTFDWVGEKNDASGYDPKDFLFDAIVLNNTQSTVIRNIVLGSVNGFINSINSSNICTGNISIAKSKVKEVVNSNILASNLNIFVGESGNLQVTLMDIHNNPISSENIVIFINGDSKNLTTDGNGNVKLPVKYSTMGTYFATIVFAGDEKHNSSFRSVKITVSKKTCTLTAPKATLKVKKAKTIKITLKSNGKVVAGKKVTLKVNGKTFSAKTNSKGVASVKVKVNKKGTFRYTVKFAGDNANKIVTKKGKIIVKK
ncbi:MAG: Ig-like domain repeat protein [Methanobrevibacter sp.]|nr:Ig-like domain repeat protein [Methanobrevibacter sp.]